MEEENLKGIVTYLNTQKGYGFVEIAGYEKNIFFHARDTRNNIFSELKIGDTVEIQEIKNTPKGFNATGVYLK